jgi:sugar/nucleoside kinase (ribokinase family)
MGPPWIVVKKGEHGVLFYCDQFMFSFPAYPVEKVVDPTGAGDTFAGGLMGGQLAKSYGTQGLFLSSAVLMVVWLLVAWPMVAPAPRQPVAKTA